MDNQEDNISTSKKNKPPLIKPSRFLDPKTDVVFKKIFGQNPDLIKSFLNAVLPLSDDHLKEALH